MSALIDAQARLNTIGELVYLPVTALLMRILLIHGDRPDDEVEQFLHKKIMAKGGTAPTKQEFLDAVDFLSERDLMTHTSYFALTDAGYDVATELWGLHLALTDQRPVPRDKP